MAIIERTFSCNCKEVSISHNGTSYLVICGKHVNGGYCAFPRLKIAAELSGYDGDYGYNEMKLRLVLGDYVEDVTELARIITDTIRELPDVLPF
ncbi:MAG: DUF6618 family protein [Ruminococcus sp.]